MTYWSLWESSVPAIGKRLGVLLTVVAGYCIVVDQVVRALEIS